ncbi:MAG: hypothetical protein CMJ31_01130 [Phycisphaerae bacterium]|nr:hypothetical protein [Phycisphaerae bacterium]
MTIWVLAIFATIQLVSGGALWFYQRSATIDLFEQRLLERAANMAAEIETSLPDLDESALDLIARQELRYPHFERYRVDVLDADGRSVVYPQTRWPETAPDLARRAIAANTHLRAPVVDEDVGFFVSEGASVEAIALPVTGRLGEQLAIVVATSDAFVARQLALTARVLIAGGLVGLIASAISGWLIAGMAVDPFRRLSGVAGQLTPENLDREIVVESPTTEVSALTEELESARERLRSAFAVQERFLSNISHEIKTPIATLLTEAQTINKSELNDEAREFVEVTEDEMRKLGRLVESFLTLTRVREGSGVTRPRRYPANELVMDSLEDCQQMAEQYAVRLNPRLASGEDAMDLSVVGDPALLRTMLNNLIRNAIRFSPKESRVGVVASQDDTTFVVAVDDEGPGIPPEVLEHLFDRFVQSRDEVRRERGHGLGLAIAKGIAELHGGDVVAENRPEGGARFTLTLPIEAADGSGVATDADHRAYEVADADH